MSTTAWRTGPVSVRVPATSANLGPGYDSFGLALHLHDLVEAEVISDGLRTQVSGVGEETAQDGERHLVVRAMRTAFDLLGGQPPGLRLRCANAIPHGFGLGSSAAAIVAGLLAARALAEPGGLDRLPDQDVLGLAADLEGHADNVAACLYGGLTIAWTSGDLAGGPAANHEVRSVRLDPLADLTPVVCIPGTPLATEAARQVLPAMIPHAAAARNAARAALLVAALTQSGLAADPELLLEATTDFLHQPYRAASMPASAGLVAALQQAGIPAVVSGAGPAVLALVVPGLTKGPNAVAAIAAERDTEWTVRELAVDRTGAVTNLA